MTAHLSDDDVDRVVAILDRWRGSITWEQFLALVQAEIGRKFTRQGLRKRPRIADAWDKYQSPTSKSGAVEKNSLDPLVARLREKLGEKENEIARLKSENEALLDQFRTWAVNASNSGLYIDELSIPLPRKRNR